VLTDCLAESDLQEIGKSTIADFDRRVASLPAALCAPFHEEARQLEAEVLTIYKFVVMAVRRDEDLNRVAKLWGAMVQVCDIAALSLRTLVEKHPHCGADIYYDRLLDLRNKCQRLQTLHA